MSGKLRHAEGGESCSSVGGTERPFPSLGQGGSQSDHWDTDSSFDGGGRRCVRITVHEHRRLVPLTPRSWVPATPVLRRRRQDPRQARLAGERRPRRGTAHAAAANPGPGGPTKPGPQCFPERERLPARLLSEAGQAQGTGEGPLITPQPSRAAARSICVPPTARLGRPPRSWPANHPPSWEGADKMPHFPLGPLCSSAREGPAGAAHTLGQRLTEGGTRGRGPAGLSPQPQPQGLVLPPQANPSWDRATRSPSPLGCGDICRPSSARHRFASPQMDLQTSLPLTILGAQGK